MSGQIFSGLSLSSTLTVNWNVYYETFPTPYSNLVTLAKPSCVYDYIALEMLSRILSEIPVGVPAGDNWDGEWWADAVEKLASFAPAIGTALAGPAGMALGTTVGVAGKALGSFLRSPADTAGSSGAAARQAQPKMVKARHEVAGAKKKNRRKKKTKANTQTRRARVPR
jgi:hypothetical protein